MLVYKIVTISVGIVISYSFIHLLGIFWRLHLLSNILAIGVAFCVLVKSIWYEKNYYNSGKTFHCLNLL